ncbi:MAG: transcriptional regulator, LacI family [Bryobacterales bacterium]|nr:transcriptional regulator, LacI family [Bryobacterales bacterium]
MRIRMKDIARDLGVSVVTVSKVVRNLPEISEETRRRVQKRIKELDYRPNQAARSLATGRMFMVGLIVPDLVHPFFAQVAKGAAHTFRKHHYGLMISSSEQDPELERQEIRQMLSRGLDVLLVASAQAGPESFRWIEEQEKPYVLVDRKFDGLAANFVGADDVLIGKLATANLIANGCRRIAHLGGKNASTAAGRLEGYHLALAESGLPAVAGHELQLDAADDNGDAMGYEGMKALLNFKQRPDGVFCFNDPMAMGAMEATLDAGLRIPQDIAFVGCGNVKYARMMRVPLTTVDQKSELLGEKAAALALEVAESKGKLPPQTILLEPTVVERESSRRQ